MPYNKKNNENLLPNIDYIKKKVFFHILRDSHLSHSISINNLNKLLDF
jgi:hypothetical protein